MNSTLDHLRTAIETHWPAAQTDGLEYDSGLVSGYIRVPEFHLVQPDVRRNELWSLINEQLPTEASLIGPITALDLVEPYEATEPSPDGDEAE